MKSLKAVWLLAVASVCMSSGGVFAGVLWIENADRRVAYIDVIARGEVLVHDVLPPGAARRYDLGGHAHSVDVVATQATTDLTADASGRVPAEGDTRAVVLNNSGYTVQLFPRSDREASSSGAEIALFGLGFVCAVLVWRAFR